MTRHQTRLRSSMPTPPKVQRCAIYTRKSTDHNLDLAFNSLDAQREACEAYIKSQSHEGWRLVPDRFDDGAFSGASLDRPALQQLLDMVRARKIDVIVVYKVDRLTRALADFAKLVELFDEHGVSFVSVTQSFNTTSSMGRLTLNVLLSFAQFEREVIGERVRDKISASKRKGIWVGGPIPLGYRSVDKKLVVDEEQAELVRRIFADYLRLGSVAALVAHLNRHGPAPKPRLLTNGTSRQASSWRVGPLAHVLKNRFYIGEVAYRGEVHPGEHPAIVDREIFEAVQTCLKEKAVAHKVRRSQTSRAFPLTGRIFDDRGHPMSPSHANKRGVRYRYYVSQALLQGWKEQAGSVQRVTAPDIEDAVLTAVRKAMNMAGTRTNVDAEAARPAHQSEEDQKPQNESAARHIARIIVSTRSLTITFSQTPLALSPDDEESDALSPNTDAGLSTIAIPWSPQSRPRKGIAHEPSAASRLDAANREALLRAIAKAQSWIDGMVSGRIGSFEDIARTENLAARYVRRLAPLAYLAPNIVQAIADGTAPADLTISGLTQKLPHNWRAQKRAFGIPATSARANRRIGRT